MIAAIPYFALRVYTLDLPVVGQVPLDPWALLVCVGFVVGMEISRHRGIKLGLDVRDVVDGVVFIVVAGFLMGHVITVVAYEPQRLREDGIMAILRFWEGFSSFGGFLGAALGSIAFFRWIRPRPYWRYADVIAYGFPFGWFFGRVACGTVHDHIGALTTFPLAMRFPDGHFAAGLRHELGLYEAAFMLVVCAAWVQLGRKDRPPGFFLGALAVVYAPVRFGLDFLRNTDLQYHDNRYLGLTPAQWGCFAMLGLGIWVLARIDWKGFRPWALDGQPDQERRAVESLVVASAEATGGADAEGSEAGPASS